MYINLKKNEKIIKYKAESLLGIHLSDFCREELVYTLIHPSHEAVLLPILRRGTADLLKQEVEESDTMSGPSDNCFLTCVFGVKLTYVFFLRSFLFNFTFPVNKSTVSIFSGFQQTELPAKLYSQVLCWNVFSCSGGVVVW